MAAWAFSAEVQEVVDHSELIKSLGCKDLEERHWKKIFTQMESNFIGMDRRDLTLNRMIEDGALDHQEYIQEVAGNAMGEAKLSSEMDEVKGRWAVREFVVASYRDQKDKFIIKEVEDIITELGLGKPHPFPDTKVIVLQAANQVYDVRPREGKPSTLISSHT